MKRVTYLNAGNCGPGFGSLTVEPRLPAEYPDLVAAFTVQDERAVKRHVILNAEQVEHLEKLLGSMKRKPKATTQMIYEVDLR